MSDNKLKTTKRISRPASAKELIASARSGGHDSLGIMCDPESIAAITRIKSDKIAKQDRDIIYLNRKNSRIRSINRELDFIKSNQNKIYKAMLVMFFIVCGLGATWSLLPWWISWNSALLLGAVGYEGYVIHRELSADKYNINKKLLKAQDEVDRLQLAIGDGVDYNV